MQMFQSCITLVLVKACLRHAVAQVDHCGLSDEWEEALFSAAVFDVFGPANPGVPLNMGYSWSHEQKAYAIGRRKDSPDRKQRGLWYGYNNKKVSPNEIAADAFQAWRKELKGEVPCSNKACLIPCIRYAPYLRKIMDHYI